MPYQAFDPSTGQRAYFHSTEEAIAWCVGRPSAFALTNFHTEGDRILCGEANFAAYVGR